MNAQRFITATHIMPVNGSLPEEAVLVFESERLVDIIDKSDIDPGQTESYQGTLLPGFVNAHCHLELSHMKGRIDSGTGLTHFLKAVVTQDPVGEEEVLHAIHEADQEMWESGIMAVGDISNLSVTADAKVNSPMAYYTFVEMFDFMDPEKSDHYYEQYNLVYETFRAIGLEEVSRVPHSPYTVSRKLEEKLAGTLDPGLSGSIHMLENEQESLLLTGKKSEYIEFFESLGFSMEHYLSSGRGSMEQFLASGYQPDRMLFVHNTVAGEMDLELMSRYSEYGQPFLVTCPNANLYIESRLPDYELWLASGLPICIGTDSYSSNYQLSIWNEICTIKANYKSISWEDLIRWGSLHGARALHMEDQLGSFEVGKSPGAVLLEHGDEGGINLDCVPRKIV